MQWDMTQKKTFRSGIDSVVGQYNANDLQLCQDLCQQHRDCVGITFNPRRTSQQIDCVLRKITKAAAVAGNQFENNRHVDYYELIKGNSIKPINICNLEC